MWSNSGYTEIRASEDLPLIPCKVYRRRWFMLLIFVLYSMANAAQWIQYSIVSNVVQRYYGVSSYAVDWTSIIYMLTFTPFIFPALAFLDRMGLRKSLILGALGTALGSAIKCFSVHPDLFVVTFVGQTLVAICQVFILGVPPYLASVWFGADQISTACALGVFGNQVGVAAGFVVTPLVVRNHNSLDDIGSDFAIMFYFNAALTTFVLFLIIIFFQEKPPLPPRLEVLSRPVNEPGILQPLKRLLCNCDFHLLMASYGINVAVCSAFGTLLNQLVLIYFEGGEELAGCLGLVFVVSGMVGSVVCGILLDKTHMFKETSVALYAVSVVSMVVFTFILGTKSQLMIYATTAILGAFMGGYMPVGFEFACELTYPESESTTSGLLLTFSQMLGVAFTMGYAWLMDATGDVWANVSLVGTLVVGTALTALIGPNLRRQEAHAAALSALHHSDS